MANTIAGANLAAIAEESLPSLMDAFAPLSALTTDFSSDISDRGESVTSRYPTNPTAVDLSSGYSATDVTLTGITITLNTFYGFVWQFTDAERSKSSVRLNDLFIEPAAEAIRDKVFGDIWDLVVDANIPAATNTEITSTYANLDRDDIADAAQKLTTSGVPKTGRSLWLDPQGYAAIAKDLNAADSAGQTVTIGEHRVPRLHGFDVYECSAIDGNSQNVYGWAGHRSNLLMAARSVDSEMAQAAGVEVSNVVVPGIELPVQFRKWYDPDNGVLKYSMGVLYGVKFGVPSMGLKFVTA